MISSLRIFSEPSGMALRMGGNNSPFGCKGLESERAETRRFELGSPTERDPRLQ